MPTKKRILFIVSNMETGGVSKSMTSLMNAIDRKRYDVSLMVVTPKGPLMELLPADFRVIANPVFSALTGRLDGFRRLVGLGKPFKAVAHLARLAVMSISKPWGARMMARLAPELDEKFDVAVDFNGQHQLYYMVNKVKATKKVTFFHNDYKKWPYYHSADNVYFGKVDNIFTVSDVCLQSLKECFPQHASKMQKMENIVLPQLIRKMASMTHKTGRVTTNTIKIATVAHAIPRKGIDLAISAAKILKDKGIPFQWNWVGATPESDWINEVEAAGLSDVFRFVGTTPNPYPYIAEADIFVLPSRYEGKSIALDETKIIGAPAVVTNFSTVGDQFTNGFNANIVEMDAESLAKGILDLVDNPQKRDEYRSNMLAEDLSNLDELEKLYTIFDSVQ